MRVNHVRGVRGPSRRLLIDPIDEDDDDRLGRRLLLVHDPDLGPGWKCRRSPLRRIGSPAWTTTECDLDVTWIPPYTWL